MVRKISKETSGEFDSFEDDESDIASLELDDNDF